MELPKNMLTFKSNLVNVLNDYNNLEEAYKEQQKEIEELYTTAATSYQNAKFKLLSESPIFQVLDQAGPPYSYTIPNWKKFAAMAFVISFVVLCLFFCRRIFFRLIIDELSKA